MFQTEAGGTEVVQRRAGGVDGYTTTTVDLPTSNYLSLVYQVYLSISDVPSYLSISDIDHQVYLSIFYLKTLIAFHSISLYPIQAISYYQFVFLACL